MKIDMKKKLAIAMGRASMYFNRLVLTKWRPIDHNKITLEEVCEAIAAPYNVIYVQYFIAQ